MDNNKSAMFDDYIDMVRKDPASMDGILADNEDISDKLEPVLRAALWFDGIATYCAWHQMRHFASLGARHQPGGQQPNDVCFSNF
ncbi:MAG: hypothetical protein JXA49_03325 [Actinobacteria bacterium]|nr:hypothetical protein [Actinomycetota bacterium]